jgi:hypothetical protein
MSQKTGTKQEQKRREKQMAIKPNWKGRKNNKTLNQKSEKGRKKPWQKGNKREGTEDQGSDTWIASFESLSSNASFLVIHQSFKSLFTDCSYVSLP